MEKVFVLRRERAS